MSDISAAVADPVRVGVIGAGRIGTSHATLLAREVPGAYLVAVADARAEAAERLAGSLGCRAVSGPAALLADDEVEAVVIAASSTAHAELVVGGRPGRQGGLLREADGDHARGDRPRDRRHRSRRVALQVGFNSRGSPEFAAAHRLVAGGDLGTPQLMRSLTRDPGLADPGRCRRARSSPRP